jgi:hypothetical protein
VEQQKSRHPERSEGPLYFVFVFASAVAFVVAVLHTTHPAESRVSEGVEQQKSRHPERSEGPLYFVFVFASAVAFVVAVPPPPTLLRAVFLKVWSSRNLVILSEAKDPCISSLSLLFLASTPSCNPL